MKDYKRETRIMSLKQRLRMRAIMRDIYTQIPQTPNPVPYKPGDIK